MQSAVVQERERAGRKPAAASTWLGASAAALYVALAVVGFAFESARRPPQLLGAFELVVFFWGFVIGWLILRSQPRQPIGWIFCASSLTVVATYLGA